MKKINELMEKQFLLMCKTGKLFRSKLDGRTLWDEYLKGFKNDPTFRDPESSEHNCNHCNNFIKRYGNIVAVDKDFNIITLFDITLESDNEYFDTFKNLSEKLQSGGISEIFTETFDSLNSLPYESCKKTNSVFRLGVPVNHKQYTQEEVEKFGVVELDKIYEFRHFSLDIPKDFVDMSGSSIESIQGTFRDNKNVFKRGLDEIPLDTLELVSDLIKQGSLLNGDAQLIKLDSFIVFKREYDKISENKRDNWAWVKSYKNPYAKFNGELIGDLCNDLATGVELNKACSDWNKRVDPANYMKAVAPITEKQKKDAQKFVDENGYTESFNRRYATLDDIKVSEILHVNNETNEPKSVSIFDKVQTSSPTRHKKSEFDKIETVPIDKFMEKILPTCTSVEVFLENGHEGNLVTLTTASTDDTKRMFKWDNNYSWTFNGNLAGKSEIKEKVKERGGNVSGVIRFSIIWNESGSDTSDLDAWCRQPDGQDIGYARDYRKDRGNRFTSLGGQLDLDIMNPGNKIGVENIYFIEKSKLKNGIYNFWVNQYSARNSQGFKAEIEVDGEIRTYEYNQRVSGNVMVAEVEFKNGEFTVYDKLPSSHTNKEIYNLETNKFHKVNLVCLSPNYWGENGVGNKHYLFMLDGCKNPNPLRTFHVENLNNELLAHRKVMEVLGNVTTITPKPKEKQLSGVGFNSTVRDSVVLKLGGSHKRVIKVEF